MPSRALIVTVITVLQFKYSLPFFRPKICATNTLPRELSGFSHRNWPFFPLKRDGASLRLRTLLHGRVPKAIVFFLNLNICLIPIFFQKVYMDYVMDDSSNSPRKLELHSHTTHVTTQQNKVEVFCSYKVEAKTCVERCASEYYYFYLGNEPSKKKDHDTRVHRSEFANEDSISASSLHFRVSSPS